MTSAAVYARVSSKQQAQDQTIGSQVAALREHAAQNRLEVPGEWVFADEGHSGAMRVRPGPEPSRGSHGPGEVRLPPGYQMTSTRLRPAEHGALRVFPPVWVPIILS